MQSLECTNCQNSWRNTVKTSSREETDESQRETLAAATRLTPDRQNAAYGGGVINFSRSQLARLRELSELLQKARFVSPMQWPKFGIQTQENILQFYFLRRCFSTSIKLPQRRSPKTLEPPQRKTKPSRRKKTYSSHLDRLDCFFSSLFYFR